MSEEIKAKRKPTRVDRKVLALLQKGMVLSHPEIEKMVNSTQSRDIIYRLRLNGNPYNINSKWVQYINSEGIHKKFKQYFITPPEIKAAGQKVERCQKEAKIVQISKSVQLELM